MSSVCVAPPIEGNQRRVSFKCEYCPHITLRKHNLFRHNESFHKPETENLVSIAEYLEERRILDKFLRSTDANFYRSFRLYNNSYVTYYKDISTVKNKKRYVVIKYLDAPVGEQVKKTVILGTKKLDDLEIYDLLY